MCNASTIVVLYKHNDILPFHISGKVVFGGVYFHSYAYCVLRLCVGVCTYTVSVCARVCVFVCVCVCVCVFVCLWM